MTITIIEPDENEFSAITFVDLSAIEKTNSTDKFVNLDRLIITLAILDIPNSIKNEILSNIELSIFEKKTENINRIDYNEMDDINSYIFENAKYEVDTDSTDNSQKAYEIIGSLELSNYNKNRLGFIIEDILFSDTVEVY